jgi:hypothetical protein
VQHSSFQTDLGPCIMKLLSGGRTGVDRAILDVAIEKGID